MRLWSLHPKYLDAKGLVALWREGLLALHVLEGRTRGYRHHPQLERFRAHAKPAEAIRAYLTAVHAESLRRGYGFDLTRLGGSRGDERPARVRLRVTVGQLEHEAAHLRAKLAVRDAGRLAHLPALPEPHPLFRVVPGGIAPWERP